MRSILVTGSNGHTGSALINGLLAKPCGDKIKIFAGISAHSKLKKSYPDMETRLCPYGDQQQLLQSLKGIDSAYLMVPFARDMVAWGRQFVESAVANDVKFIVRLSGLGAALDSDSAMGRLHGQIDELVRRSGINYCILRCNSFMQNFTGMYRAMIRRGTLALAHGDAGVSFIDTDDIASVAANVIASPDNYSGVTLDLHGPRCLSNRDIVAAISRATGNTIEYLPINDERAREGYRRAGLSEWEQQVFCSLDNYFRAGYGVGSSDNVERIIGHKANDFLVFSELHRDCWL